MFDAHMRVQDLLSRLQKAVSRATSSGAFIAEIDGLRFIAIVAVVAFHLGGRYFERPARPFWEPGGDIAGWVVYTGFFGVQLFFVISGFVLALPFAQAQLAGGRPVELKKYFWRRITRLQPPYMISLVLFLIVALINNYGKVAADIGKYLEHLVAHAFYLHGAFYGPLDTPGYFALNHVTWSLEVEVQFYIIAPLLAMVYRVHDNAKRRMPEPPSQLPLYRSCTISCSVSCSSTSTLSTGRIKLRSSRISGMESVWLHGALGPFLLGKVTRMTSTYLHSSSLPT
jgi:peptidoglycan/LPS O-acetylase OafA/YrhL